MYVIAIFSGILLQFFKEPRPPIDAQEEERGELKHLFAGSSALLLGALMKRCGKRWIHWCAGFGLFLGMLVAISTRFSLTLESYQARLKTPLDSVLFTISILMLLWLLLMMDAIPYFPTRPEQQPVYFLGPSLCVQGESVVKTQAIFLGLSVSFGIAGVITSAKLIYYPSTGYESIYPLTYDAISVIVALLEVTGLKYWILQTKLVLATGHFVVEGLNIFMLTLVFLTNNLILAAIGIVCVWQLIRIYGLPKLNQHNHANSRVGSAAPRSATSKE